ncbi:hypothetical protein VPH35_115449 [Triticum aestivum]|uniref:uncharacterized protein n=1 Tax=Triticum aestivum TaxID=4565 RepID=UPI001D002BED|nr:uncharacterized protein LOC123141043 [Triticum aestivum]
MGGGLDRRRRPIEIDLQEADQGPRSFTRRWFPKTSNQTNNQLREMVEDDDGGDAYDRCRPSSRIKNGQAQTAIGLFEREVGPAPTPPSLRRGTTISSITKIDRYEPIARMLARHQAVLNLTCKLMKDRQHSRHAGAVRLRAAAGRSAWSSLTIMRWSCTTSRRSCRWPLPPNPLGCARSSTCAGTRTCSTVRIGGGSSPWPAAALRYETGHSDLYMGFVDAANEHRA